eukprot:681523-Amphidinium_carterae.1
MPGAPLAVAPYQCQWRGVRHTEAQGPVHAVPKMPAAPALAVARPYEQWFHTLANQHALEQAGLVTGDVVE